MFIVLEKVSIYDNSVVPSWYVPDELMAHWKFKKKKKKWETYYWLIWFFSFIEKLTKRGKSKQQ